MARLFRSLLALALLVTLCSAQKRCRRDKDCDGLDFCQAPICVRPLEAGDACNRDEQCLSQDCRSNGRCNSITRRLVVGAIVGIAIGAVVLTVILGICVYCCCFRKSRRSNDAQA